MFPGRRRRDDGAGRPPGGAGADRQGPDAGDVGAARVAGSDRAGRGPAGRRADHHLRELALAVPDQRAARGAGVRRRLAADPLAAHRRGRAAARSLGGSSPAGAWPPPRTWPTCSRRPACRGRRRSSAPRSPRLSLRRGGPSARVPHPLVNLRTLRVPTFRASRRQRALFWPSITAVPFLLTLLFQDVFGWSPLKSGAVVLIVFIGNVGIKPDDDAALRRFGFRPVLVASTAGAAATMVAAAFLDAGTPLVVIAAVALLNGVGALGQPHLLLDDRLQRHAAGADPRRQHAPGDRAAARWVGRAAGRGGAARRRRLGGALPGETTPSLRTRWPSCCSRSSPSARRWRPCGWTRMPVRRSPADRQASRPRPPSGNPAAGCSASGAAWCYYSMCRMFAPCASRAVHHETAPIHRKAR